jgi:hypothetical protein
VAELQGQKVTLRLASPGAYVIYVQAVDKQKEAVASSKDTVGQAWSGLDGPQPDDTQGVRQVYCSYVRRELRSLLPEDRRAFLDAARALWTTPMGAGQALYGPDFRSIDFFEQYHLHTLARRDCDVRSGVGFWIKVRPILQGTRCRQ